MCSCSLTSIKSICIICVPTNNNGCCFSMIDFVRNTKVNRNKLTSNWFLVLLHYFCNQLPWPTPLLGSQYVRMGKFKETCHWRGNWLHHHGHGVFYCNVCCGCSCDVMSSSYVRLGKKRITLRVRLRVLLCVPHLCTIPCTWVFNVVKQMKNKQTYLCTTLEAYCTLGWAHLTMKLQHPHDLLHPPASSRSIFWGECNHSTLCNQSRYAQHSGAFFVKLTVALFYWLLFYRTWLSMLTE